MLNYALTLFIFAREECSTNDWSTDMSGPRLGTRTKRTHKIHKLRFRFHNRHIIEHLDLDTEPKESPE